MGPFQGPECSPPGHLEEEVFPVHTASSQLIQPEGSSPLALVVGLGVESSCGCPSRCNMPALTAHPVSDLEGSERQLSGLLAWLPA